MTVDMIFQLAILNIQDKKEKLSKCAFNLTVNVYNIKVHLI